MLTFAAACTDAESGKVLLDPVAVQSTEMDTVATVTWQTEKPGESWIEYGDDTSYGYVTNRSPAATEHSLLLAGLPVAHTTHWRAVSEVDGAQLVSADQTLDTRPAPSNVPDLTVNAGESDRTDFIATSTIAQHTFAFVFDRRGRLVWYDDAKSEGYVFGEASLSRDGTAILYSIYPTDHTEETSYIARVSLDKLTRVETPTVLGHHDFVELPEGGYAWMRIDVRDIGGQPAVGDTIVESDAEGNVVREVWNAWDQITPPDAVGEDDGFYVQGWDWLHGNTLNYDEARDVYLYSARAISTVYVIDRASGETLWSVGDEGSLSLASGTRFVGQHQPKLLDNGNLLLFDNTDTESYSAAREYAIDLTNGTYSEVWSYQTPAGQWAYLLGDVTRLDDGATVVAGGTLGYVAEVDADGTLTWRVDAAIGNILGFTEVLPHLGGPS